jgi:hypothetical protein
MMDAVRFRDGGPRLKKKEGFDVVRKRKCADEGRE